MRNNKKNTQTVEIGYNGRDITSKEKRAKAAKPGLINKDHRTERNPVRSVIILVISHQNIEMLNF